MAVAANDSVDNLYGLRYGAAHDGACNLITVVSKRRKVQRSPILTMCAKVIPSSGAGVVIIHALFKERDELVTGFYGKVPEL